MNPRLNLWLGRAERWGRRAENTLLLVLLAGLILLASAQIFLRNALSTGFLWTDGLVRLMVLWVGLAGGVAASRDGKQIAIDIVTRTLPAGVRRITDAAAYSFTAAVTGLLAWHSGRFVRDSYVFQDTLLGDWPAWAFQIILPAGFGLICYRYLLRALRGALGPGT